MSRPPDVPTGFVVVDRPGARLVADRDRLESLLHVGLERPEAWCRVLSGAHAGAGRGATALVDLGGGAAVRLKQLRRGGFAAGIWRGRFAGAHRLYDNLRVPVEARHREVPSPAPVALLVVEGPPRLFRGWLAVENVAGASSLVERTGSGPPPAAADYEAVSRVVRRMHDAGIEHRDLNLGNLLLRHAEGNSPEVFVIDLDGGRVHAAPLPFRLRQRALRRLERSQAKCLGDPVPRWADGARDWYRLYAAGDEPLRRRLLRGRWLGRTLLAIHRLGWPRRP